MSTRDDQSQDTFKQLKVICVPILENSLVTPQSIPRLSELLSRLIALLRQLSSSGVTLKSSSISYAFFPLSSILRRNASNAIPDQILEKLLLALATLCEWWWWDCDLAVWEQIFMLCGAIVGGIEGKGKGKERDDETKDAAAQCLWALLRPRHDSEIPQREDGSFTRARARNSDIKAYAQSTKFIPVLGQTLDSLLATSGAKHVSLQRRSLRLLHVIVGTYATDGFVPSILPGVVSTMSKIALGLTSNKGWATGETVDLALKVMGEVIVRSVGDDICLREGAVRSVSELEDLVSLADPLAHRGADGESRPFSTARTPAWLRGTSSQLHIALNTLTPLVSHPTPAALLGLAHLSETVLAATSLTLPQTQPLLLSFLLSLSNSDYPTVHRNAHEGLTRLLDPTSNVHHSLLQSLVKITRDNLLSLPRLLPSHADAKVEHIAGLIEAVCRLSTPSQDSALNFGITSIAKGVGKLLGPSGGVEKWGWSLLFVLEFADPPVTLSRASAAQLMLENDPEALETVHFPEVTLKHVSYRSTYVALARMFRSLGHAGGDESLFAAEWFASIGRNGRDSRAVAALWCASRLLEGVANIALDSPDNSEAFRVRRSKRVEKVARGLARSIAELWDGPDDNDEENQTAEGAEALQTDDTPTTIEHVQGIISIRASLNFSNPTTPKKRDLRFLHKALSLQLLSVTAGILEARFTPLLLHTLYPVLRSIVSSDSHLASTALASLHFITRSTSYASPANLLLANFDYALDAVSRRLTRRWLDVEATKVMVVLVRLVGSGVVEKAGDVVEECFDRLDEFHGYEVVVQGLVEVLGEVIKVVEMDEEAHLPPQTAQREKHSGAATLAATLDWFSHRQDPPPQEEDNEDYGPAPRRAWGESKGKDAAGQEDKEKDPAEEPNSTDEKPATPTQALTTQIVSRSLYFLTHGSPAIRARILVLLGSSVPVLPESALLPSIHQAWPFILNRLSDPEPFVVSAAASLVEALVTHVGTFMYRRIWDDVWPRFHKMLGKLDAADPANALSKRGPGAVGTESAYTHSHRLYKSLIKTMAAAIRGVDLQDEAVWQVILAFRRFLSSTAHEELQVAARDLYIALGNNNSDAVWLALYSTAGRLPEMKFMEERKWDIDANVTIIFNTLD
ncbi:hypothetical protein PLICRDRAFT_171749 [Plicaturopsis crispa FD-325 SS-3]|nr:hypothetical protein PLICRDRAFT_171749 [Plicaturopsis crispa FD-325 SS-3]